VLKTFGVTITKSVFNMFVDQFIACFVSLI